MKEGSSATDFVTDVTDGSPIEVGRSKKEGFSYRRDRTDSLQWFQQLRMF